MYAAILSLLLAAVTDTVTAIPYSTTTCSTSWQGGICTGCAWTANTVEHCYPDWSKEVCQRQDSDYTWCGDDNTIPIVDDSDACLTSWNGGLCSGCAWTSNGDEYCYPDWSKEVCQRQDSDYTWCGGDQGYLDHGILEDFEKLDSLSQKRLYIDIESEMQIAMAAGERIKPQEGPGAFAGYDSLISFGKRGSPLNQTTVEVEFNPGFDIKSKSSVMKSALDRTQAIEASAYVSGPFGYITGSVGAGYLTRVKLENQDTAFTYSYYKTFKSHSLNRQTVKITNSAKQLLKDGNVQDFVDLYGKNVLLSYTKACGVNGRVHVKTKTISEKHKVDMSAGISYVTLLSGDGNFERDVRTASSTAKIRITYEVVGAKNLDNPTVLTLQELREKVLDKVGTDAHCDESTARIVSVEMGSWLAVKDVLENIRAQDIDYFIQGKPALWELRLLENLKSRISALKTQVEYCAEDYDECFKTQFYVKDKSQRINTLNILNNYLPILTDTVNKLKDHNIAGTGYLSELRVNVTNYENDFKEATRVDRNYFQISQIGLKTFTDTTPEILVPVLTLEFNPITQQINGGNPEVMRFDNYNRYWGWHHACYRVHGVMHTFIEENNYKGEVNDVVFRMTASRSCGGLYHSHNNITHSHGQQTGSNRYTLHSIAGNSRLSYRITIL